MSKSIGFIGLGAIGHPAAVNLIAAGYDVYGFRRSDMSEFVAAGGRAVASPREIADHCDTLFTCLPDGRAVSEVITGPDGVLSSGKRGLKIIELSSLRIAEKEQLRKEVRKSDGDMLDCPVSGIPPMIVSKTAVIFVSGDQAVYNDVRPYLDAVTDKANYIGEFGLGSKLKFIANHLVSVNILATAEALAFGAKAGLSPHLVSEALSASAASSLQFQTRAPMMADAKWLPALGTHEMLHKDLKTITEYADEIGCPTPLLHTAEKYFERANTEGRQNEDVASIYELIRADNGL